LPQIHHKLTTIYHPKNPPKDKNPNKNAFPPQAFFSRTIPQDSRLSESCIGNRDARTDTENTME
jgi:hypothetical protein